MSCAFCGNNSDDVVNLGSLLPIDDIYVHYYCILLSTTIKQSGKDDEGIFGFMREDIEDELRLSTKKRCCYCKKPRANVKCKHKKCYRWFHLPCGLAHNTLHMFCESYESVCFNHRPNLYIPESLENDCCLICREVILNETKLLDLYFPKCCGAKGIVMHIYCVKLFALNSGYCTKCPNCNNVETFCNDLKKSGVFVPQRDASWELEDGAFSELLHKYSQCDSEHCKCTHPLKNKYNVNRKSSLWKILLCKYCGNSGMHRKCNELRRFYICKLCNTVIDKNKSLNMKLTKD